MTMVNIIAQRDTLQRWRIVMRMMVLLAPASKQLIDDQQNIAYINGGRPNEV
jgi:hypothetical protein